MQSLAEENYLKAIHYFFEKDVVASTNQLALRLNTRASSVTDMLKKLAEKMLIFYTPYRGVTLTEEGERIALAVIRRHRLWEYFLVKKLNFKWDEVHIMAEELEHISSSELVNRLEVFLGSPEFDPHGDPIPDCDGNYNKRVYKPVSKALLHEQGIICGVGNHSPAFLQYLEKEGLMIGTAITVTEINGFDNSVLITAGAQKTTISREAAANLLIKNE